MCRQRGRKLQNIICSEPHVPEQAEEYTSLPYYEHKRITCAGFVEMPHNLSKWTSRRVYGFILPDTTAEAATLPLRDLLSPG